MLSRLPAAVALAATLFLLLVAPLRPADAAALVPGDFTDAAGRHVLLPAAIGRVMPADRNAEVLLFVLAPDKLAGLERSARGAPLPRNGGGGYLPTLDWGLRTSPAQMAATARRLGANLIVDGGTVTPERAAFADQVQQLTGIPYILIDDSFSRMPLMLRALSDVLGDDKRGDRLARYADHAISGVRGRLLITPAETRPRVYFALGPDGMTTALPGSPAGAALDEAGALNVAAPLGRGGEVRVSPAQLIAWNPDYIIVEDRRAYAELRRDRLWRSVAAVRQQHVFLEPTRPFGWIEDPSGVNRLIGLNWLSTVFYPAATAGDLRTTVCEFYDLFYRTKLTNGQIEAMVRPAGAPPIEVAREMPDQLIGLGTAPPSAPPAPAPSGGAAAKGGAGTGSLANPAAPGAGTPSALTGVPGLPNTGPSAQCTVPTGPTPQPLPGLAPVPGVPAAPGVPLPGQRGHPMTSLDRPVALAQ